MVELYGSCSDNHYLCNKDFNECYVFDSMGRLLQSKGAILDCNVIREVDIFSAIPLGGKRYGYCEVYFQGKKKVFHCVPTLAIYKLRSLKNFLGTIFRVEHKSSKSNITVDQLLLVLPKNIFTHAMIDSLLGAENSVWEEL